MRWQFGGNSEPTLIICETDWRQCPVAIVKYIWTEVVADVVDCLRSEGTMWRVLVGVIVCTILFRVLYSKLRWIGRMSLNKQKLNRVGCKVQNLELKVNILTYKMQYGTWPLLHQLRNSNLRKELRNVRLTLSTSNDRNAWMKQILFSPSSDASCVSYSKIDTRSMQRLSKLFDLEARYALSPADYRDVKLSKTNSNGSLKYLKKTDRYLDNVRAKDRISKSENFDRAKPKRTQKPLTICVSKKGSELFDKSKRNVKDCEKIFEEANSNDNDLSVICSASTMNSSFSDQKIYANNKLALYDGRIRTIPNLEKRKTGAYRRHGEEIRNAKKKGRRLKKMTRKNYYADNLSGIVTMEEPWDVRSSSSLNDIIYNDVVTTKLLPSKDQIILDPANFDLAKSKNKIWVSREALNQIKEKLESLENVMRLYDLKSFEARKVDEEDGINDDKMWEFYKNVIDTFDTIKMEIENIHENKESKTTTIGTKPKENEDVLQTDMNMNNCEQGEDKQTDADVFGSIQRGAKLINDYEEEKNYESPLGDSNVASETVNTLCITVKNNPLDGEVPRASSNDSFQRESKSEVKDRRDETFVENASNVAEASEKSSTVPIEVAEDPMITLASPSQAEASKDSDSDGKSTTMLLREALKFKEALLTQIESDKFCLTREIKEEETPKADFRSNLDIITEERSASSSTDRSSKTYIHLKTKDRNASSKNSLMPMNSQMSDVGMIQKEADDLKECASYDAKRLLPTSSEHFSFGNLLIHASDNVTINDIVDGDRQANEKTIEQDLSIDGNLFGDAMDEGHPKVANKKVESDNGEASFRDDNEKYVTPKLRGTTDVNEFEYNEEIPAGDASNALLKINNITELVRQSVKNVRDITDLFSQNQNNAIMKIRKAIRYSKDIENMDYFEYDDRVSNEMIKSSSSEDMEQRTSMSENEIVLPLLGSNSYNVTYELHQEKDEVRHTHDRNPKRQPGLTSLAKDTVDIDELFLNKDKVNITNTNSSVTSILFDNRPKNAIATTSRDACKDDVDSYNTTKKGYGDRNKTKLQGEELILDPITEFDAGIDALNHKYKNEKAQCGKEQESAARVEVARGKPNLNVDDRRFKNPEILVELKNVQAVPGSGDSCRNDNAVDNINYDKLSMKSKSNLLSEQSSTYFVDEVSSSILKLNSKYLQNSEQHSMMESPCENPSAEANAYAEHKDDVQNQNVMVKNEESTLDNFEIEEPVKGDVDDSKANGNFEMELQPSHYDRISDININADLSKENIIETPPSTDKSLTLNALIGDALRSSERENLSDSMRSKTETRCDFAPDSATLNSSTSISYIDARSSEFEDLNGINLTNASSSSTSTKKSKTLPLDKDISCLRAHSLQRLQYDAKRSVSSVSSTKSFPSKKKSFNANFEDVKGKSLKKNSSSNLKQQGGSNLSTTSSSSKDWSIGSSKSLRYNDNNLKLTKSRSYISPSYKAESLSYCTAVSQNEVHLTEKRDDCRSNASEDRANGNLKSKYIASTPRMSTKSCIPISKRRLSGARRTECESRSRSPTRSPLTMTALSRDKSHVNIQNTSDAFATVEGTSVSKNEAIRDYDDIVENARRIVKESRNKEQVFVVERDTDLDENKESTISRGKTIIYVNIVTHRDQNITRIMNPKKLLEYMRDKELIAENWMNGNCADANAEGNRKSSLVDTEKAARTIPRLLTIVPSSANENLEEGPPSLKISTGIVKSIWSATVQQKEREVTAKPSVIDTSTSVSDLQYTPEISNDRIEQFEVFGTPRELTNEEYSSLFEMLNQNTNSTLLQDVRSLYNKLKLELRNVE